MTSSDLPLISIIVLNWNGADDTLACLDSLGRLTYANFEVIVVDNGSSDNSFERLSTYRASYPLRLLNTGKNLGYAGGNNFGIRDAIGRKVSHLLVLNNDTIVASDLLEQFLAALRRNENAGILSARILYSEEPDRVWFDRAVWNEPHLRLEWPGQGCIETELGTQDRDTDYACGAALFFREELVRDIGLLDESFFLVWEEVDWSFRARKAGWRCIGVPQARIWHKVGASFGGEDSPLRVYFSTRNRLLWFRRHASFRARMRLWKKTLDDLIPAFQISSAPRFGTFRPLLWALSDYLRSWLGGGNRLLYLTKRRAVRDYVMGRFGDCPDEVRAWSRRWVSLMQSHQGIDAAIDRN